MDRLRERAKGTGVSLPRAGCDVRPGSEPDEVCRDLVESIPPGWQHPTRAGRPRRSRSRRPRLRTGRAHRDAVGQSRAPVARHGKPAGAIECVLRASTSRRRGSGRSSRRSAGCSINIALRLGQFLTERRLRGLAAELEGRRSSRRPPTTAATGASSSNSSAARTRTC